MCNCHARGDTGGSLNKDERRLGRYMKTKSGGINHDRIVIYTAALFKRESLHLVYIKREQEVTALLRVIQTRVYHFADFLNSIQERVFMNV